MEQSYNFQSIGLEPPTNLSWNDEEVQVVFKHGQYSCPDLPGFFTTRAKLEEAWRIYLYETRGADAREEFRMALKDVRKIRENSSEKTNKRTKRLNAAKKEVEKWHNP